MNLGVPQIMFMIPIVAIICGTVLALARMKAKERAPRSQARLEEMAARLERIEQAIDALAVETERISEGQRFTTKLLGERAEARRGD
jgi:hypothetical protein